MHGMKYTDEMKQFILDNYKGRYNQELVDLFNQKFNTNITSRTIKSYKANNNLNSGLTLPFPILSSVFKGIRKGETMSYAMPSNSGKSRFTIDLSLIHI